MWDKQTKRSASEPARHRTKTGRDGDPARNKGGVRRGATVVGDSLNRKRKSHHVRACVKVWPGAACASPGDAVSCVSTSV